MNYQRIRLEAENEAKEILKNKTKFGSKEFKGKNSITVVRESSLHSLLSQEDIDYCVNNNLDIEYLYNELYSKYGGAHEKKQYYVPTGKKRGRPKIDNNEQEQ